MKHLLVTNDFPPKHGGIQTYLWELWRRLPADQTTILTTPFAGADEWDRDQPFRVVRSRHRVLLPTRAVRAEIDALADEVGAELVILDPALPLGALGPSLARPYGLVIHGAEVTVPGRVPLARRALRRTLIGARLVVAAGGYPADEAELAAGRGLPIVVVPPGVDHDRFVPLDPVAKRAARARLGLPVDGFVVAAVSRLVPRKGFDTVIRAAARLAGTHPDLIVAVTGAGRDRGRLERLARATGSPTRFLGRVPDRDLPDVYGCADLFAMVCRSRWFGLEQEGFGIVFLEAAAAGVPQLAGRSGGADEAVVDGTTGLVVDPLDEVAVAGGLARLIDDPVTRQAMAEAGLARVRTELSYDRLAGDLLHALDTI